MANASRARPASALNAILATNAALYKRINFDAVADFAPIGLIGSQANILVVNPALPVKSMAELIALARANPGKLNFASSGHGLAAHLAGELFGAGQDRSPPVP
jgi:tripartite-type tricarboxylate transporter receptor subunit TctC